MYCAVTDVKAKLDTTWLSTLAANDAGTVDDSIITAAIVAADAAIDAYVRAFYAVPLSPVPSSVRDISATLAVGKLVQRKGLDFANWQAAWDDALGKLKLIASGILKLDGVEMKVYTAAPSNPVIIPGRRNTGGDALDGF
ncbi:MAG: DUF1320 family protein [Nitrospinae bacterium]|nr:DUF1320 family protein [Nitrospinota bacterium]